MNYTVAEAARLLERPEHFVRARCADGTFDVVGKGRYGASLLNGLQVRQFARIQRLGELGRRQKLVLVLGDPPDAAHALRIAGLTPERATNFMDALARHNVAGAPIIVATPDAVNAELGLLPSLRGSIHLAVATSTQTAVPWQVELMSEIVDPYDPRALVQWAWSALEQRTEAGALKL